MDGLIKTMTSLVYIPFHLSLSRKNILNYFKPIILIQTMIFVILSF